MGLPSAWSEFTTGEHFGVVHNVRTSAGVMAIVTVTKLCASRSQKDRTLQLEQQSSRERRHFRTRRVAKLAALCW